MGLGGSSVGGFAAIDNCAPSGCTANGCSAGCVTNGYFHSYPYHTVCGGSTKCTKQTSVPLGTGCSSGYSIFNFCTGRTATSTLFECGPDPRSTTNGFCAGGGSAPVIACVTTALFSYLCGGCNPYTYGLISCIIS